MRKRLVLSDLKSSVNTDRYPLKNKLSDEPAGNNRTKGQSHRKCYVNHSERCPSGQHLMCDQKIETRKTRQAHNVPLASRRLFFAPAQNRVPHSPFNRLSINSRIASRGARPS